MVNAQSTSPSPMAGTQNTPPVAAPGSTPTPNQSSMDDRASQPRTGIAKMKSKMRRNVLIGVVGLLLLVGGIVAAFFLSRISQDVRQQAFEPAYSLCSTAGEEICYQDEIYRCDSPISLYKPTGETCRTFGEGAEGDLCSGDADCIAGLVCQNQPSNPQSPYLCSKPGATKGQGELCSSSSECRPGLVCENDSSNPQSPYQCKSSTGTGEEGALCNSFEDCKAGLVCENNPSNPQSPYQCKKPSDSNVRTSLSSCSSVCSDRDGCICPDVCAERLISNQDSCSPVGVGGSDIACFSLQNNQCIGINEIDSELCFSSSGQPLTNVFFTYAACEAAVQQNNDPLCYYDPGNYTCIPSFTQSVCDANNDFATRNACEASLPQCFENLGSSCSPLFSSNECSRSGVYSTIAACVNNLGSECGYLTAPACEDAQGNLFCTGNSLVIDSNRNCNLPGTESVVCAYYSENSQNNGRCYETTNQTLCDTIQSSRPDNYYSTLQACENDNTVTTTSCAYYSENTSQVGGKCYETTNKSLCETIQSSRPNNYYSTLTECERENINSCTPAGSSPANDGSTNCCSNSYYNPSTNLCVARDGSGEIGDSCSGNSDCDTGLSCQTNSLEQIELGGPAQICLTAPVTPICHFIISGRCIEGTTQQRCDRAEELGTETYATEAACEQALDPDANSCAAKDFSFGNPDCVEVTGNLCNILGIEVKFKTLAECLGSVSDDDTEAPACYFSDQDPNNSSQRLCIGLDSAECESYQVSGLTVHSTVEACAAFGESNPPYTGACTTNADCPGSRLCYQGQCQLRENVFGQSCSGSDTSFLGDGSAGSPCCQGQYQCNSGLNCDAGNGGFYTVGQNDGKIGTCIGGAGGPVGPTCQPGELSCGGCGGFCTTDFSKGCNAQAFDRCGEVVNGGSCAVNGYNSTTKSCEVYCTNILGKNGDDCSAETGRPCRYIGPESTVYERECPNGNGWGEFGWNQTSGCFENVPSNGLAISYYCPCPNGDCTGVTLGAGCLLNPQIGNACYQAGNCGVRQVDVDIANPTTGQTQHTSRNMLITSGCNVVETSPPTTPPAGTPPPETTPPPAVGPQCRNITRDIQNPQIGDLVTFTCGTVDPVDYDNITTMYYAFRMQTPDGNVISVPNVNPISADRPGVGTIQAQYQIEMSGQYKVQCTICPDGTCYDFEPLNGIN